MAVAGLDTPGIDRASGADPFGAVSATPWLRSTGNVGIGQVCAALVTLGYGKDGKPREDEELNVQSINVIAGDVPRVVIAWSDGLTQHVELGPVPA